MRIAHIILSRGFAGSERATAEMCNAHSREHNVLLILRKDHRRDGTSIRDYVDAQVEVVEGTGNGQRGGYCEVWIRDGAPEEPDLVVAAPIQEESTERVP